MATIEAADMLAGHQAAKVLDVTPQTVTRLAGQGRLPFVSTALGRLYPRAAVEALAAERAAGKPPKAA